MAFKLKIWILILFSLLLCTGNAIAEQYINYQTEERSKAVALFDQGKFSEALQIFTKLANAYPADYLLKYYAGASMVESGIFTKDAEMYLLLAISREVPMKSYYYLARYYHANESWDNAVRFYNRFRNNVGAEEAEKLRTEDLINLAYDKYNPYIGDEVVFPENVAAQNEEQTPETADTLSTAVISDLPEEMSGDSLTAPPPPEIATPIVKKEPLPVVSLDEFIHFQVNPQVVYLKEELFQEPEALALWKKARDKEAELQTVLGKLEEKRTQYQKTGNPAEREKLVNEILAYENTSLTTKMETEQLYSQARNIEQKWWDAADYAAYEKYASVNDSLRKLEEQARQASTQTPEIDMALIEAFFAPEDEKEEEDHGVVYKIQLGVFTRTVPVRTKALFDKIGVIRPIETFIDEQGATVYTTGNVKTYEAALELQEQVRLEGVKDAIAIALKDEQIIPIEEAKKITGKNTEQENENDRQ
ncbi:MAG: hypothetical protein FWG22_02950 [Prolixibacteraceae bacterium]|nr:hypothetical protein [Prolixibacteraceae bacterium]